MAQHIFLVAGLMLVGGIAPAQTRSTAEGAVAAPETWGTAAGYTTRMAHDFTTEFFEYAQPVASIEQFLGASYCPVGIGGPNFPLYAQSQVRVPDGARLTQLQFWAYDTDPVDGLTIELWETCQAPGFNAPVSTSLGSADSVGAIGTYFGFIALNDHRVNNRDCGYTVRVNFNPGAECKGTAIQLQKVQVSWVREAAPAPGLQTFADVPQDHPFFRYIEALASSGVTGGCGSFNYCPDAPLTRGQMATFLAKALGLEWP